ncbi:hypothetical protein Agub_g1172, partial [Astrephomene gubernaculifera]
MEPWSFGGEVAGAPEAAVHVQHLRQLFRQGRTAAATTFGPSSISGRVTVAHFQEGLSQQQLTGSSTAGAHVHDPTTNLLASKASAFHSTFSTQPVSQSYGTTTATVLGVPLRNTNDGSLGLRSVGGGIDNRGSGSGNWGLIGNSSSSSSITAAGTQERGNYSDAAAAITRQVEELRKQWHEDQQRQQLFNWQQQEQQHQYQLQQQEEQRQLPRQQQRDAGRYGDDRAVRPVTSATSKASTPLYSFGHSKPTTYTAVRNLSLSGNDASNRLPHRATDSRELPTAPATSRLPKPAPPKPIYAPDLGPNLDSRLPVFLNAANVPRRQHRPSRGAHAGAASAATGISGVGNSRGGTATATAGNVGSSNGGSVSGVAAAAWGSALRDHTSSTLARVNNSSRPLPRAGALAGGSYLSSGSGTAAEQAGGAGVAHGSSSGTSMSEGALAAHSSLAVSTDPGGKPQAANQGVATGEGTAGEAGGPAAVGASAGTKRPASRPASPWFRSQGPAGAEAGGDNGRGGSNVGGPGRESSLENGCTIGVGTGSGGEGGTAKLRGRVVYDMLGQADVPDVRAVRPRSAAAVMGRSRRG